MGPLVADTESPSCRRQFGVSLSVLSAGKVHSLGAARRRSSGRDRYAIHDSRVNGDIRQQQIFTRDVYHRLGSHIHMPYNDVPRQSFHRFEYTFAY